MGGVLWGPKTTCCAEFDSTEEDNERTPGPGRADAQLCPLLQKGIAVLLRWGQCCRSSTWTAIKTGYRSMRHALIASHTLILIMTSDRSDSSAQTGFFFFNKGNLFTHVTEQYSGRFQVEVDSAAQIMSLACPLMPFLSVFFWAGFILGLTPLRDRDGPSDASCILSG